MTTLVVAPVPPAVVISSPATTIVTVPPAPQHVSVEQGTTVSVTRPTTSVAVDTATHDVVVAGTQGPRGPQGVPGPSGSEIVAGTAAEALGGHRMVRGARDALTYATNTDASHADDIQGLTLGAAAAGAGVLLQRAGDVTEPSWSWTPETPVFLGPNGQLTQTPPDDSAAFTLCVGFAATPTTLVLRFEAPIYNED